MANKCTQSLIEPSVQFKRGFHLPFGAPRIVETDVENRHAEMFRLFTCFHVAFTEDVIHVEDHLIQLSVQTRTSNRHRNENETVLSHKPK